MRREFSLAHTVRYDECDCDGLLTPATFVRYMQELAACDAEDAGLVGDGYWVVRRSVISFATPVQVHTPLLLKTYGLGFTRITAQRGYEARLASEPETAPPVCARSLWVFVDPQGRPARLPERTAAIWLPDGPVSPQPESPFPAWPEDTPASVPALVRFSDMDLARHLNNASAVEMLDDAGWDACARHGIMPGAARLDMLSYDIEYVDSPRFGDVLEIQSWLEPLPTPGQEFTRFQQITRASKPMVRAHSRWLWRS